MKKSNWLIIALFIIFLIIFTSCGGGGADSTNGVTLTVDPAGMIEPVDAPQFAINQGVWKTIYDGPNIELWYNHIDPSQPNAKGRAYLLAIIDSQNGRFCARYFQDREFCPWMSLAPSLTYLDDDVTYLAESFHITTINTYLSHIEVSYDIEILGMKIKGNLVMDSPPFEFNFESIKATVSGEILEHPSVELPTDYTFNVFRADEYGCDIEYNLNSGFYYTADDIAAGNFHIVVQDWIKLDCFGVYTIDIDFDQLLAIYATTNENRIEVWAATSHTIPDSYSWSITINPQNLHS